MGERLAMSTLLHSGRPIVLTPHGYGAVADDIAALHRDVTTEDYAAAQNDYQAPKTHSFILPVLRERRATRVLDVGCGVGGMVETIAEAGYEAYGVDLIGLDRRWRELGRSTDRFFIVDPERFALPFADRAIDFAFSLGVIEHVGTTDGHADRRPDWHAMRRDWLREVFRTLSVGGRMLIGGPNRGFPIDVAHGLDSRAAAWERWLSSRMGRSVHRTWGDNFLWSFADVPRYLDELAFTLEPRSVDGLLDFGRVPAPARGLARAYVRRMPRMLLGTGLNPWMLALVTRTA
jgi:SAM-dependent methyltransferase